MDTHAASIALIDAEAGQRLDNFLLGALKGVPRSRIYRMLRRGEVRVNGARSKPSRRLAPGDRVRIPPHRAAAPGEPARAPAGALDALLDRVLYEDDDLLVLDKPSGHAVHGGSGVSFGIVEALRGSGRRLELAHRLDRDTSGCLMLAKNRATLLKLHDAFRSRTVAKRYEVVVAGTWPAGLRRVDAPLKRYALASGERRVRAASDGEPSRTDFEVVARQAASTWLAAFPKTGRTHQIRVHAAASGHPVLGDEKYGVRGVPVGASRLMLHASRLRLVLDGHRRRFEAPLPPEFEALRPAD